MKDYLEELEGTKDERTEQVKLGLELYIELWKKAIQRGIVSESDRVDDALAKVDAAGGLYQAAGD